MMDTGDICGRSFQLYKQYWKQMLVIGAITATVSTVVEVLALPLGESGSEALLKLVSFLLAPILASGMYRYCIKLWRGEQPSLTELLHYCHSFRDYGRVLLFYLVYYCCFFACLFLGLILPLGAIVTVFKGFEGILTVLIVIAAMIFYIWFTLRMFLAEYLFLFQDRASLWDTVKEGFERMDGHVFELIVLQFLQMLLSLVYAIPLLLLLPQAANSGTMLPVVLIIFAIIVIVSPLMTLMLAGFASEVLQDKQFVKDDVTMAVEWE